jgi:hypothetical protein
VPDTEAAGRPHCDACGVDMWLTRVLDGTGATGNSYVFECKVCGAQVTLSAPQGGAPGLEDRL